MSQLLWSDIIQQATTATETKGLGEAYRDRLKFELGEIEKQGAEAVWIARLHQQKRYATNPNNLILPWLLGMVTDDPMAARTKPYLNTVRAAKITEFKKKHGFIPTDLIKDTDSPDIDIDCLPDARDPLKAYAIERYGQNFNDAYGSVCSVGTWQTYKFKSAIVDAAVALGKMDRYSAEEYTTQLPEDVDELKEGGVAVCKGRLIVDVDGKREEKECGVVHNQTNCPQCRATDTDGPTLYKLLYEQAPLQELYGKYPEIVEVAVNLIGRIRTMGMHAGAIIITDRPLYGNIPLARSGRKGYWVSMWTEGRNTQLSKFGYIKWDLLGLKTLKYIFNCCKLIEENRGISFGVNMSGWDDIDPIQRRAGHFFDGDGNKHYIHLDDPHALALANEQKTDGVFQFDTDLAKSILANGVRSFEDLMLFNAMGHPGPMASIPEAVRNRDETRGAWQRRLHPEFLKVLEDTYGVICYQEQLQALWQNIAGFTSPEAQEARKAVAKKWAHKLKPIEQKWLDGASKKIGMAAAVEWWSKMVTFGRYAFNRCLVAGTVVQDIDGYTTVIENARGLVLESSCGPDVVVDVHFNGYEPVYKVTFSNGVIECVTMGHRYLTDIGMVELSELSSSHAIKYISRGVTNGETTKINRSRRTGYCSLVSGRRIVQDYNNPIESESDITSDNCSSNRQILCEKGFSDKEPEVQGSLLFGQFDTTSMLLDGVLDGRWICKRQERNSPVTTGMGREPRFGLSVCGIFRLSKCSKGEEREKESDFLRGKIRSLKCEIDREIERIRNHSEKVVERDTSTSTIYGGFHKGVYGWRWDDCDKCERLPDGWVRFEFGLSYGFEESTCANNTKLESQQAVTRQEYCEFRQVSLDWLRSMQSDSQLDAPTQGPVDEAEARHSRIHIKSIEYIGLRPVYSPEMLSKTHDYSIAPNHPIAANSHAVSYCLMAHRCLWLKAHFAPEFWAAVMSDCHPDKLVRYMGIARAEGWTPTDITYCGRYKGEAQRPRGVSFDTLNIQNLTVDFTVTGDVVNQGLTGIKGIGGKAAKCFQGKGTYTDLDDFVNKTQDRAVALIESEKLSGSVPMKTVVERFIKLGAFKYLPGHENTFALWQWYQYKYCKSGQTMTALRREVKEKLLELDGWTNINVEKERSRQIAEWKRAYPKRNKIPTKFHNWKPKPIDTRERVMGLYARDFTMAERLEFQKQFLGYWIDSPLDLYDCDGDCTIAAAKERAKLGGEVKLEGIIVDATDGTTKKGHPYLKVFITDGIQKGLMFIWSSELNRQDFETLKAGAGVSMYVDYDDKRGTFSLVRGEVVQRLMPRGYNKRATVEVADVLTN